MDRVIDQVIVGLHRLDDVVDSLSWVWTGMLLLGLGSLGWLASDRAPPFQVLEVYPAAARAGEYVTIVANVRRDLHRKCDAIASRSVFDGRGTRFDEQTRRFTRETIEKMGRESPGILRVSVKIPGEAAPGSGSVVSDLDYQCNITHAIWPIKTSAVLPITILPSATP